MTPAGPDRRANPSNSADTRHGPGPVWIYCLDQDRATTSSPGLYNYCRQLLLALSREPDPGFAVRALVSSANAADLLPASLPPWMRAHVVGGRFSTGWRRLLADHVLSSRIPARGDAALIHYPKGWLPLLPPRGITAVATVADTIVQYYDRHHPRAVPWAKRRYFDLLTRRTLRQAHRIITFSESSRLSLSSLRPEAAHRILVIPPGPGIRPAPPRAGPRTGLLMLGSRMPHKATAEALRLLAETAPPMLRNERVTVTGLDAWPAEWGSPPLGLSADFVGTPSDDRLRDLYSRCRALVLPSRIEGFGLPALEAYASGMPVCYRNTSSLAEVLGDLPGGWDGSEGNFAAALDAALAMPAGDVERARRILDQRFNWARSAAATLALYRAALQDANPR